MSCINSSPPSAVYMRQWIWSVLVQIMACRLFSAKSLSKPLLFYFFNQTLRYKFQWKSDQNTNLFIHEIASENIFCEMAAILSRGRWVKPSIWPLVRDHLAVRPPSWEVVFAGRFHCIPVVDCCLTDGCVICYVDCICCVYNVCDNNKDYIS